MKDLQAATAGGAIALLTLRQVIDEHPDWGRDEILEYLGDTIRVAPMDTADLDALAAFVEREITP